MAEPRTTDPTHPIDPTHPTDPTEPTDPTDPTGPRGPRTGIGRARAIRLVVGVVVALLVAWAVVGLLGEIDWSQVWSSISSLTVPQVGVLAVLLVGVRTLNATPFALFIPGLSLRRAVANDLAGNLVSTVAPPPSDIVVRYSMFKSWRIDLTGAFAGVTLDSIVLYVVRFAAPAVGVALVVVGAELTRSLVIGIVLSVLLAGVLAVALVAVVRSDRLAARVGAWAGRVGHRVRPTSVDAAVLADRTVAFRASAGGALRAQWWRAALALGAMALLDATILLAATRFMGVGSAAIPSLLVYGAYLVLYPLTSFPFAGLGVLDAALVELALRHTGASDASPLVAALVVWRVTTVLVPLLVGVAVYLGWRSRNRTVRVDVA